MQARVGYAAVGAFVLLLGAALLGSALWLGTSRERGEFRTYLAYTRESVGPLGPSSRVTYHGVEVGKVAEIALDPADPARVRLMLAIREGTPVKTDTYATIAMQGLTGLGSVELAGGSREAPPLRAAPGSAHPVIPMRPSLLNRLDTALGEAIKALDQAGQRLLVLLDEDNTRAIAAFLANAEHVSATLAANSGRIERVLADLETLSGAGAQAAGALPELTQTAGTLLADAQGLIASLRESTAQVTAAAGLSHGQIEYTGGVLLPEVERLVTNLRRASETLDELGGRLNANPQMLLVGPPRVEPGPGE